MMIGSQFLGQARLPVRQFAVLGGATEWIELFYNGFPAGKIHFRSEYFPQEIVGDIQITNQNVYLKPSPVFV